MALRDSAVGGIPQDHELTGRNRENRVRTPILAGELDLEHWALVGHDDRTNLPAAQYEGAIGLAVPGARVFEKRHTSCIWISLVIATRYSRW